MVKGYWVSVYPAGTDTAALAVYDELAGVAVRAGGGRVLSRIPTRGGRLAAREGGVEQRVVLIEFESFEAAVAAYESGEYVEALGALPEGFERDFRIVEGVG